MNKNWDNASDEAIKGRLDDGLDGRTLQWLADETGESYRNVSRWLGRVKESSTTPAHFIARYVAAIPVRAEWVLLGEEPKYRTPPGEAEVRLAEMAKLNAQMARLLRTGNSNGG